VGESVGVVLLLFHVKPRGGFESPTDYDPRRVRTSNVRGVAIAIVLSRMAHEQLLAVRASAPEWTARSSHRRFGRGRGSRLEQGA
jgi:hypothetical protein